MFHQFHVLGHVHVVVSISSGAHGDVTLVGHSLEDVGVLGDVNATPATPSVASRSSTARSSISFASSFLTSTFMFATPGSGEVDDHH